MFDATIKRDYPQTVAYLAKQGPYEGFAEGYEQLYSWIADSGLEPAGMPAAAYITTPGEVPEADARWELWVPLAATLPASDPNAEGLGVKEVDAATVASAMHEGPYERLCETYEQLSQWLAEQGYRVAGPPLEIYYSDPDETPPEEYLTEVQIPVEKA